MRSSPDRRRSRWRDRSPSLGAASRSAACWTGCLVHVLGLGFDPWPCGARSLPGWPRGGWRWPLQGRAVVEAIHDSAGLARWPTRPAIAALPAVDRVPLPALIEDGRSLFTTTSSPPRWAPLHWSAQRSPVILCRTSGCCTVAVTDYPWVEALRPLDSGQYFDLPQPWLLRSSAWKGVMVGVFFSKPR